MTTQKSRLYAVAGVTGHTGAAAADALLEKGARVRVIVRSEEKGKPWKKRGAEVAVADVSNADALTRALKGADGAYLLSPPDIAAKDFLGSRKAMVDAMAKAIDASGVPHVVFLSSVGAQHKEKTGVVRSLNYAEGALAKTRASVTFVRAGFFVENWAAMIPTAKKDGVLPAMWADQKIPHIATRDIGETAAKALLNGPKSKRHVIELAGPQDASPRDVASVLSKLLKRDVNAVTITGAAMTGAFTSMGASENVAKLYQEMFEGINNGAMDWEGGSAEFVRGKRSVGDVLGELVK